MLTAKTNTIIEDIGIGFVSEDSIGIEFNDDDVDDVDDDDDDDDSDIIVVST